MSPWERHQPSARQGGSRADIGGVHLEMLGWSVVERRTQTGLWRDVDGDLLGLARVHGTLGLPPLRDEAALRRHGGLIAATLDSRLVEAEVLEHVAGPAAMFVCRRIQNWALVFTGILMVPASPASWVWSMVARGRPVTGDLHDLCEDCVCPAHPLARVHHELRKLLTVRLDA